MPDVSSRFEVAYARLRALAERCYFHGGSPSSTMQPTALVHEAFLRVAASDGCQIRDDEHFLAIVATAMRQIMVDHARRRGAFKRGGNLNRVAFDEEVTAPAMDPVVFDDVLSRLQQLDARQARIVELRVFAGVTVPEVAQLLDVSVSTVEKEWRQARAWMRLELQRADAA